MKLASTRAKTIEAWINDHPEQISKYEKVDVELSGTIQYLDVWRSDSNARGGKYHCPWCGHAERIREYLARRGGHPPTRRLVAKEEVHRQTQQRRFRAVSAADRILFERAARELRRAASTLPIPKARVVVKPGDSRPRSYGFDRDRDMFNARQLLHHANVLKAIVTLREPARAIALLAFSQALETNCMFCPYATDWRRLAALFSIHGYMYVTRPVELNPWLHGVGRGTLRNCIGRIRRALESKVGATANDERPRLFRGSVDAAKEKIAVHFVVTDPPYFDNLDYGYLARFHSVWLSAAGIRAPGVAHVGGRPITVPPIGDRTIAWRGFYTRLVPIFRACRRSLRRHGLLVFTFANRRKEAWTALGQAVRRAGLRAVAVYGVETEGKNGFHHEAGNLRWNALFVCRRRGSGKSYLRTKELRQAICVRGLSEADEENLQMALHAACAMR